MTEDFTVRFANLLTGLADYYRQPVSESATRIYAMCLQQFLIADIEAAAIDHVNDPDRGKFMPKVADFVAVLEGNVDQAAALAWDQILHGRGPMAGVDCGSGNPPRWSQDPAAEAAIKSMGGWDTAIGQRRADDMPFAFKDFLVRYKAFKRRETHEKSLLTGTNVLSISQAGRP